MVVMEHLMVHQLVNALVVSVPRVLDPASLDQVVKLSLNFDCVHVLNHELDSVFVQSLIVTTDDVDLNYLMSIKMLWNDLLLMVYSPDEDDVNSINQLVVAVMMNLVPSMNHLVNLLSKMMNSIEMKLVVNLLNVRMNDFVVIVLEMVALVQDADVSMNFVVVAVDDATNYCYYSDYLDLVLIVTMHQLDFLMVDILLMIQSSFAA